MLDSTHIAFTEVRAELSGLRELRNAASEALLIESTRVSNIKIQELWIDR